MNPDVLEVYNGKKIENTKKNPKNNNRLKTKTILKIKMSAKGVPVFPFSLPGWRLAPLVAPSVTSLIMKHSYLKVFSHRLCKMGSKMKFCAAVLSSPLRCRETRQMHFTSLFLTTIQRLQIKFINEQKEEQLKFMTERFFSHFCDLKQFRENCDS